MNVNNLQVIDFNILQVIDLFEFQLFYSIYMLIGLSMGNDKLGVRSQLS